MRSPDGPPLASWSCIRSIQPCAPTSRGRRGASIYHLLARLERTSRSDQVAQPMPHCRSPVHAQSHPFALLRSGGHQRRYRVDRTPSLSELSDPLLIGSPEATPTRSMGSDHAASLNRRKAEVAAGWKVGAGPTGDGDPNLVAEELDSVISTAAARTEDDTPVGSGSSSSDVESARGRGGYEGASRGEGQWQGGMDMYVLTQPAPPFAIVEASADWLHFCGFSASEVRPVAATNHDHRRHLPH